MTMIESDLYKVPQVRASRAHIERVYAEAKSTQQARYLDWMDRNERYASDRVYELRKLSDFYARALITEEERQALHVTRWVIEALTKYSFSGTQGQVAEWTDVLGEAEKKHNMAYSPIGEQSYADCLRIMRENSYDISEGVRFIRTPLALAALERKYYLLDLVHDA